MLELARNVPRLDGHKRLGDDATGRDINISDRLIKADQTRFEFVDVGCSERRILIFIFLKINKFNIIMASSIELMKKI